MVKNKELKRRIVDISYRHKLSHLGSCLTAVDIINDIYETMHPLQYKTGWDERFVLSSGHAGLALYVVLEKFGWGDAEELFNTHGVHPNRDIAHGIYTSTGSLGQGLPIAVGMALANREKRVFCLVSDGEMAEGSINEARNVIRAEQVTNLKLYINNNGWAAYRKVGYYDLESAPDDVKIYQTNSNQFPFLKGLDAHYYTMKEEDYKQALKILK